MVGHQGGSSDKEDEVRGVGDEFTGPSRHMGHAHNTLQISGELFLQNSFCALNLGTEAAMFVQDCQCTVGQKSSRAK